MITGLLMLFPAVKAQKPNIDLLPSTHQRAHPEANVDTSFSSIPLLKSVPDNPPASVYSDNKAKRKFWRIESQRKGLKLDSLFHKKGSNREWKVNRQGKERSKYPLFLTFINPIKLFYHITALKL